MGAGVLLELWVEGRWEGRGHRFYLLEAAELGVTDFQGI